MANTMTTTTTGPHLRPTKIKRIQRFISTCYYGILLLFGGAVITGWWLMAAVGVAHNEWASDLPTIGYEGATMICMVLLIPRALHWVRLRLRMADQAASSHSANHPSDRDLSPIARLSETKADLSHEPSTTPGRLSARGSARRQWRCQRRPGRSN